jgi:hypothetical protein
VQAARAFEEREAKSLDQHETEDYLAARGHWLYPIPVHDRSDWMPPRRSR